MDSDLYGQACPRRTPPPLLEHSSDPWLADQATNELWAAILRPLPASARRMPLSQQETNPQHVSWEPLHPPLVTEEEIRPTQPEQPHAWSQQTTQPNLTSLKAELPWGCHHLLDNLEYVLEQLTKRCPLTKLLLSAQNTMLSKPRLQLLSAQEEEDVDHGEEDRGIWADTDVGRQTPLTHRLAALESRQATIQEEVDHLAEERVHLDLRVHTAQNQTHQPDQRPDDPERHHLVRQNRTGRQGRQARRQ